MRSVVLCALAAVSVAFAPASAEAQSHEGRALQINTGAGGVLRGEYRTRMGVAGDAMFSDRVTRSIRWGIAASVQTGLETTDVCERSTPDGPCLTSLPLLVSGTVLLGRVWNFGEQSSWSLRTYAGPSVVRVYHREGIGPNFWNTIGGATGRIEVVKHVATHLDLVGTLRASLVPALPRDARGIHAVGFGIALH